MDISKGQDYLNPNKCTDICALPMNRTLRMSVSYPYGTEPDVITVLSDTVDIKVGMLGTLFKVPEAINGLE